VSEAPTEWDQYAATWDQDEDARAYAEAAFGSLQGALSARGHSLRNDRVCDFGCGTGLLTERLAGTSKVIDAVDTSAAMLDVLRSKIERHGWTNIRPRTDLISLPGDYDMIVCSSVCAFLDDYPESVEQLTSRLRPGGVFIQWDWELDEDEPGGHGLSRDTVRRVLTSAGLTAVAVDAAFEVPMDGQTMKPLMGIGQRSTRPGSPSQPQKGTSSRAHPDRIVP
jgi:2-polyprenyl-3-methyl-5-hydroxy-6-metoxy-1,4-benzoquinol methylase